MIERHSKLEETFYVLDGEFELRAGEEVRRALPGSVMFVPLASRTPSQTRPTRQPNCC